MKDYAIVTDSTTDLPSNVADNCGLDIIPLTFTVDEKEYSNYLDGRDISFENFYELLRHGSIARTSQISVNKYLEVIKKHLDAGKDVMVCSFSSALSGTYNALCLAKEMILEEYPNAKIITMDTRSASLGEGLLLYKVSELKKQGMGIDELAQWIEENKLRVHHWFTVDDLDFLKRGGRLSGAAAFVAKTLRIKPVLHVNDAGQLISKKKVFGRNSAIECLISQMRQYYPNDEKQTIFISHGDCIQDANKLKDLIEKEFKFKEIIINYIGPVIGSHSGPGTLALFFFADKSGR